MGLYDAYQQFMTSAGATLRGAYEAARDQLAALITRDPEAYRAGSEQALRELEHVRANLQRAEAALPHVAPEKRPMAEAKLSELRGEYMRLSAPVYADAAQADAAAKAGGVSGVGVAFLVPLIYVAGVALTSGAIAWMWSSTEARRALVAQSDAFTAQITHCAELAAAGKPAPDGMCAKRDIVPATQQPPSLPSLPTASGPSLGALALGVAGLGAAWWAWSTRK